MWLTQQTHKCFQPARASLLILKFCSLVFFIAACYHLLAVFVALNDSPVWRNLLFVLINLWCAFEIRRFKKYFVVFFSLLFIQQLISHGGAVVRSFGESHFDWLGILTLVFMTITYISLVILKFRNRHSE